MTQYNEDGWISDLPNFQDRRSNHGCSFYDNAEGTKVDIDTNYQLLSFNMIFQTYLVSGGITSNYDFLSSTELLLETASAWTFTGELPSPRRGLRGANIDNKVLMTGN